MSNSNWIRRLIQKLYSKPYLIGTNTVTGVISISIGDVLQQNLEHYWKKKLGDDGTNGYIRLHQSTYIKSNKDTLVWDSQRTSNKFIVIILLKFHLFYFILFVCFN